MIHKSVKFAYVVIMAVSAALAFIVMRNFDEAAVAGPSYVVAVFPDQVTDHADVAAMVTTFAHERRVNIGRLHRDPRDVTRERVYLAVGDPHAEAARWMTSGYPYFSREAKTDFLPYHELGEVDPSGYYFVFDSSERTADDLLRKFTHLGLRGQVDPLFSLGRGFGYFGHGALLWCSLIVGLVVMLAVASAVVFNSRSYGIQRLQGQSFGGVLARDLRQVARFNGIAGLAVGGMTLAGLYWYNQWHQLGTYALVVASFMVTYMLFALIVHALALALVHHGEILPAVKGELTAGWMVAGAYLLRGAAVVLVLSIAVSAISSGVELREHHGRLHAWRAVDDAYYMRIGNSVGARDGQRIGDRIGQWIREADSQGEIVVARYLPAGRFGNVGGPAHEILVVNDRYLVKHEIYDAAGGRVRPDGADSARLLLPERYVGDSAQIVAEVKGSVSSFNRASEEALSLAVRQIRDGQRVFSYSSALSDHDLFLRDPIIVVVTAASGLISNENYMAWATQKAVIVEDPERARASLVAAGLGPYVLGMDPMAQEAALRYRDVLREFRLEMFNLLAAVAVLLITALGVSIVYCRRYAQVLFVKYISGWGFVATHRWVLATETVLASALVLATWHRTATLLAAAREPLAGREVRYALVLGGWEPAVAVAVALLSVLTVAVVLARTNARFVKAHSASLA